MPTSIKIRQMESLKDALLKAEDRGVRYRDELAVAKETLRRTELEKELLDRDKTELTANGSRLQERLDEQDQRIHKVCFLGA